jgi:hypothetical protein
MKRKNIFYTVLAVTLLLTAAFFTNCLNPLGGDESSTPGVSGAPTLPAGMGSVVLVPSDEFRSTLFPGAANLANLNYTVFVEKDGEIFPTTGYDPIVNVDLDSLKVTIITLPALEDGTDYTFEILGIDKTNSYPVLMGRASAKIENGMQKEIVVQMKGYTEAYTLGGGGAPGTGTFAYAITIPTYGTTEDFKLTVTLALYNEGTTTRPAGFPATVTMTETTSATPTIAAGYYNVILTSKYDSYSAQTTRYVLHIYPGRTSTLTETFKKVDAPGEIAPPKEDTKVILTFDAATNGGLFKAEPEPPAYATPLSLVSGFDGDNFNVRKITGYSVGAIPPAAHQPGVAAKGTLASSGWYRDPLGDTLKWAWGTDKVWGDTILYAIYGKEDEATGSFNVKFTIKDLFDGKNLGTVTFLQSLHNKGQTATVSLLSNPGTFITGEDFDPALIDDVVWYLNNKVFSTGSTQIILYNNTAHALPTVADDVYIPGTHKFSLECTYNTIPVSLHFTLVFDPLN